MPPIRRWQVSAAAGGLAAAVAVGVLLTAGGSTSSADSGRLSRPQHETSGSAAIGQFDIPADGVVSIGSLILCVTGRHPAAIVSVTPVRPSAGFVVQEWGVRPNPFQLGRPGLGAEASPLSAVPGFTHGQVTGRCDSSESVWSELGVQVSKTQRATATANGLRIDYRINDQRGTFVWPYTITLCAPEDHASKHCKDK